MGLGDDLAGVAEAVDVVFGLDVDTEEEEDRPADPTETASKGNGGGFREALELTEW